MPKENVPIFESCGPVMIGPPGSHTAGVARITDLAHKMYGAEPGNAVVSFYGSLASTRKGHGSGMRLYRKLRPPGRKNPLYKTKRLCGGQCANCGGFDFTGNNEHDTL
ncbi:MAG: hypothetical protein LBF78_11585 [Treponema sp.]|jgi:hypothetical protein|nr:hypothetical protein [Treponema sp.]